MKISEVIHEIEPITRLDSGTLESDITGIAYNSMDIEENFVFVAIVGFETDGHSYIEQAVEKGASLVIGEQSIVGLGVPYLQVENSRKALGVLARNFYGNPADKKVIIAVTGTNGKTTTSYMLQHFLESHGIFCTVIGTIKNVINSEQMKSANTTPSSLALHKLLSLSQDNAVIMEVSSHGLAQHRLEGIEFDYALFTNLHHEHLDYHGSMEEYFSVKLSLFEQLKDHGIAVVNVDNSWGQQLMEIMQREGKPVYAVGKSADCELNIVQFNPAASTMMIKESGKIYQIGSAMNGIHNMYNTLMTYAISRLLGIPKEQLAGSIPLFKGVEGRFEIARLANGSTVVVDYAHTPDAISYCLQAAKLQGANRIIHVFGFRGDRDPSKRNAMMAVSAELSDRYVLTFDDLNTVSEEDMLETLTRLNDNCGNYKDA